MAQGGAAYCYGRLSFAWNHKLHASVAQLHTEDVERKHNEKGLKAGVTFEEIDEQFTQLCTV